MSSSIVHTLVWNTVERLETMSACEVADAFARDARAQLGLRAVTIHAAAATNRAGPIVVLYTESSKDVQTLYDAFDGRWGLLPFTLVVRDGTGLVDDVCFAQIL